jgi:hypothetical protein
MEGMAKYTGRLNFMGRILSPPIYNLCVFPRVSSLFFFPQCVQKLNWLRQNRTSGIRRNQTRQDCNYVSLYAVINNASLTGSTSRVDWLRTLHNDKILR